MNKSIVLFLDVDGVLNSYSLHDRKYRKKRFGFTNIFNPFRKKVLRLNKLIKRYDIDVYLFTAWSQTDLEEFVPFEIRGNTYKKVERLETVSKKYDIAILVEDELLYYESRLPDGLILLQPNSNKGLVLSDFKKLELIIKERL